MSETKKPPLPPRWFIRGAWLTHRAIYRFSGHRRGLREAAGGKWGTMLLTTTGRKTGKAREAIVAYFEDGSNVITVAMNGWAEPEPAWWLNLVANPEASVILKGRAPRKVRGREATGTERDRLWAHWRELGTEADYSVRRSHTAVVVLEPAGAAVE